MYLNKWSCGNTLPIRAYYSRQLGWKGNKKNKRSLVSSLPMHRTRSLVSSLPVYKTSSLGISKHHLLIRSHVYNRFWTVSEAMKEYIGILPPHQRRLNQVTYKVPRAQEIPSTSDWKYSQATKESGHTILPSNFVYYWLYMPEEINRLSKVKDELDPMAALEKSLSLKYLSPTLLNKRLSGFLTIRQQILCKHYLVKKS